MPYENLCAQDGKASLYDLAQKKGLESFLAAAQAQEGNVGEVMKSLGKVTVFAPTEGASSGSNPIDDYVVLGDQRLDHFTANCTDLSLTGVEVDELRNVSSCAVAKSLGLCNQPWIAKGSTASVCVCVWWRKNDDDECVGLTLSLSVCLSVSLSRVLPPSVRRVPSPERPGRWL